MDRGLCVVLTILTGAALGLVEACTGAADAHQPPAAESNGTMVVGAGGGSGGNGTTSAGTTGGGLTLSGR